MKKPWGLNGKVISNRYKVYLVIFIQEINNQLFKIRWHNEKFYRGRFWKRSILNKILRLKKHKNQRIISPLKNVEVHYKIPLAILSTSNCSYCTVLITHSIDFSHLLWFFNLYSWNVHQHSLNKFGNIGTKMNKSMQRNINFVLSLFVRQVNHESCKWRSKVLKWVKTLDL